MDDMTGLIRGMPNCKAVGPDSPPAKLVKLDHPEFIRCFHNLSMCEEETSPSNGKYDHQVIKRRIALFATTTEGFRLLPIQASVVENCRVTPQLFLRGRGYTPRGAARLSPSALDCRRAVCCAPSARTRTS